MLTRSLNTGGPKISAVGQGTWKFDLADPDQVRKSLLVGIDAGMTHIDTAEMYGRGRVEEIVGSALGHRRDEVFLASKVLPDNATYEGTLRACEDSLRRLRTDWLDLYMLHWPGEHPLERTIAAFRQLKEQGKIRHFGVSNFDRQDLLMLDGLTEPNEVVCNQVWYSLLRRAAVDQRVVEECRARGIAVVAYSPLDSDGVATPHSGMEELDRIAKAHDATRQQVALAFLLHRSAEFVVVRSANPAHTLKNAVATDFLLTEQDLLAIEAAFPVGQAPDELPITTDPHW